MVAQVVQRVAVLGEDEQLAAPVLQLLELRPLQALAQRDELGVVAVFAHPADARRQVPERRDLGPELIQFECRGGFVDDRVTGRLVEIVLVLLRIGDPAGDLCKPLGPAGRGQAVELLDELFEPGPAAAQRFVDRARRARQPTLEDGAHEGDAVPSPPGRLRQEFVDVGGDRLVDGVLLGAEVEADGVHVPIRKQPAPVQVLEIFLQPPERPRAVLAELQDVAPDPSGFLAEAMGLGEQVPVDEADEMREPVVVAVMGGGGQEQQVVAMLREPFGELVALRALDLVAAAGGALGDGAALVRFVDDDEVPMLAPHPLPDLVLLRVVDGGDDLRFTLPQVQELLLVVQRSE